LAVLALSIGLLVIPAAAQADSIYWSTDGDNSISFANLTGGSGGNLGTPGTSVNEPGGVAINAATSTIYWANYAHNTISFASLNGSGGGNLNTAGATVNNPIGVAINPATNTIYWANESGNSISYANLNGSGGGNLNISGANANKPFGLAIDPVSNLIYWTNYGNNTISFASLSGGDGGELTTGGASVNKPSGLAIDTATGILYWANYGADTISFANLNGTGGGGLTTTGADVNGPDGVAIDPGANLIYWTNISDNTISYTSLSGRGGGNLNTSGADVFEPVFLAILQTPEGTGGPTISGGSAAGSTLTCSQGTWAPDIISSFDYLAPQSFSYSWTNSGVSLGLTTSSITATAPGTYNCFVSAGNFAGTATQGSVGHLVAQASQPPPPPPSCTTATPCPPPVANCPTQNVSGERLRLVGEVSGKALKQRPSGTVTISYGQHLVLAATLLEESGRPAPNACLALYSKVNLPGAKAQLVKTLTTDSHGHVTYRVPTGPSQVLTLTYGESTGLHVSSNLSVKVIPRLILHTHYVSSSHELFFTGTATLGSYSGKAYLQDLYGGKWENTKRSNGTLIPVNIKKGTFSQSITLLARSVPYTFGPYTFRVRLSPQKGLPFEGATSNSHEVNVLVG